MDAYWKLNKVTLKIRTQFTEGTVVVLKKNKSIYLVTAKHCLEDETKNIPKDIVIELVAYKDSPKSSELVELTSSNYSIIELDNEGDIAIIKVDINLSIFDKMPEIECLSNVFDKQDKFIMRGFPHVLEGKPNNIELKLKDVSGRFFEVGILEEQIDNSIDNYEEIVKGYSGSGVFYKTDQNIYIVGIITSFAPRFLKFSASDISKLRDLIPEIPSQNYSSLTNSENSNLELIRDFRRQFSEAEEYYTLLKPQTALKELKRVQSSIKLSNIPQRVKNELMAESHYLEGIFLIGQQKDNGNAKELLIQAYKFDNANQKFKEGALYAYYLINDKDPIVFDLINELLDIDPFNPIAWAIKDAKEGQTYTPEIVLSKPLYSYLLFTFKKGGGKKMHVSELAPFFSKSINGFDDIRNLPIDISSFQYYLFSGIYLTHSPKDEYKTYFKKGNDKIKPNNSPSVKKGAEILELIVSKLKESELTHTNDYKQAVFFHEYAKYKLEPSRKQAQNMFHLFNEDDFTIKTIFKAYDIIFALHEFGLHQEILELIENQGIIEIDNKVRLIQAGSLEALGRREETVEVLLNYFQAVSLIDEISLRNISDAYMTLNELGYRNDSLFGILSNKPYKKEYYRGLLECFILKDTSPKSENLKEKIFSIYDSHFHEFDFNQKIMLVTILGAIGELEPAAAVLEPIVDENNENQYLEFLIEILWLGRFNCTKLFKLLKKWRLEYSYNEMFLEYEIRINFWIRNYLQIEELCRWGIQKSPTNQTFQFSLIIALYKQNKLFELQEHLDDRILNFQLPTDDTWQLIRICILALKTDLGIRLAYSDLKKHPNNNDIKMNYFSLFIAISEDDYSLHEKSFVELDSEVELEIDGKTIMLAVTKESLETNPIIKKVFNCKRGEKVYHENTFTNSSIAIKGIYSIYLAEFKKILNKNDSPLSEGLPFISFQIEKNESGELDVDRTSQKLQEIFGADGLENTLIANNIIDDYKNRRIGFNKLVIKLFEDNPFECFDKITRSPALGMFLFSKVEQQHFNEGLQTLYVLDFTSVLLFSELSDNITFPENIFILSHSIKDFFIDTLHNIRISMKDKMTLNIMPDRVTPISKPDGYENKQIRKLENIIDWINKNCHIIHPEDLLDNISILEKLNKASNFRRSLLHTLLIAIKPNIILISDDLNYYSDQSFQGIRIITTEIYLHNLNKEFWEIAKIKMILLNYTGITLTKKTLVSIFEKNRIYYPNNQILLDKALKNVQGNINPRIENLNVLIDFLIYIFSLGLDRVQTNSICTQIFFSFLKVPYINITQHNLELIEAQFDSSFALLGDAPTIAKKCLREVWNILFNSHI